MKTILKSPYTLAGTTCDGIPCFWGKKDSSDPTSDDLSFWITLRKPKRNGENYLRIANLGIDEELLFAVDYPAHSTPQEARKAARENYQLTVADFIADFIAADLAQIIKANPA